MSLYPHCTLVLCLLSVVHSWTTSTVVVWFVLCMTESVVWWREILCHYLPVKGKYIISRGLLLIKLKWPLHGRGLSTSALTAAHDSHTDHIYLFIHCHFDEDKYNDEDDDEDDDDEDDEDDDDDEENEEEEPEAVFGGLR